MKNLSRIAFLILISLPINGFCGLLIEPYAGYASLKTSGTVGILGMEADLEETTSKGTALGGRLGVGFANVGAGVDIMRGSLEDDGDDTTLTTLGGFVMANFAIVRFWGTYVFSSKLDVESDDIDGSFTGNGMKLGVGFSVLPKLSLNVEYVSLNYDKEDIEILDSIDMDSKGIFVSISIPLVF